MTRAGETGGVLDSALMRVADQLEKDDSLRRQVKAAMAYPIVVMVFAFSVLIALVVFLVPVFVGIFKQFGGDLPTITKFTVGMSKAMTGYWWAFIAGGFGISWSLQEVEGHRRRPQAVGHLQAAHPDEDRRHRPEDRARPLVAHAVGAGQRRRAAHVRPGDHRQDRGQLVRREGDGRRHRVRPPGRHDRRAAQERSGLPGHGRRT